MKRTVSIALKTALLFAMYQLIMICLLDVFFFLRKENSLVQMYFTTFLLVTGIHFMIQWIVQKRWDDKAAKGIMLSLSFLVSALISSFIFWFLFSGKPSLLFLLLFVSAFVVPALFPAVALYVLQILKENVPVNNQAVPVSNFTMSEPAGNIQNPEPEKEIRFVLENDGGKKLLDVAVNRIICFEANDNYVITYYLDKEEKTKKSMERVSLKKVEEMLDNLNVISFSRVHKSYLVHREFIEEIKGKAQAQKLSMKHLDIQIPVSRTFNLASLNLEN